jgi:hypothetical protein
MAASPKIQAAACPAMSDLQIAFMLGRLSAEV